MTVSSKNRDDSERKKARDYILASDDNMRTAIAVVEAWPKTRTDVVRRFLKAPQGRTAEDLRQSKTCRSIPT